MEPAWGRPVDAAVPLRCTCAVGLVNMRSARAIVPLVHLLAEVEPRSTPGNDSYVHTRVAAARALGAYGGEAAEALLRFKILQGDAEVEVMAECFTQLVSLTRSLEPIRGYLDCEDDDLRQAAMLAVGESRVPDAFGLLREQWTRQVDSASRKVLCLAIALTRKPEAIDFLLALVSDASEAASAAAVEALAMYQSDESVRSRVRTAARERGGIVQSAFDEHFES
jgi:HEAT repeat protein